ncbi:MAG: pitrilysin family protein [Mariprofundaceae bacterium]
MRRWGVAVVAALVMALPVRAAAVASVQEARLDNGLRVLLIEAHNVPMVVMRLQAVAGSRFDPEGKGGTAALLAGMLTDHTRRHDWRAWADWLDANAIRLGGGAGRDELSLTVTVLREALDDGVRALAEAALRPGWDRKRFALLRDDAVAAARKAEEEPGVRAARIRAGLLFAGHPYGHRPEGTPKSLARITLKDLRSLYARQFRPAGAVLAVSGDVTMPELLARVKPLFAGWRGAPAEALRPVALRPVALPPEVRGRRVSETMPTRQTLVQLAALGPARGAEDFFPALVMNHILGGGGFASRLMAEVREKRGLVYGVYSYFMPLAGPGPFVVSLQTRADQTDRAAAVVRTVLGDMAEHGVQAEELAAAKANLTGGFAHRLDSNAKRVGLLAMIGFYGLPLDYLARWEDAVRAVSREQVNRACRKWLALDRWNEIRVGPEPIGEKR